MTCSGWARLLVVGTALASAGCANDAPTLSAATTAFASVALAPPAEAIPTDLGHFRWDLVASPPAASVTTTAGLNATPSVTSPAISITPPARGIYAFDRWFVGEADEQVDCHYIVTVAGIAPTALVTGPTAVAVGSATTLDGSTSSSREQLALTYAWRLVFRPEGSALVLGDVASASVEVAPDVAGDYSVELRVFDGELWSAPDTVVLTAR